MWYNVCFHVCVDVRNGNKSDEFNWIESYRIDGWVIACANVFQTVSIWVTQRSNCSYAFRLVQALDLVRCFNLCGLMICLFAAYFVCFFYFAFRLSLHSHMCSISKLARRNFLLIHFFSVRFAILLLCANNSTSHWFSALLFLRTVLSIHNWH